MLTSSTTKRGAFGPRLRAVLFGAALLVPAAGCDSILDVDDPDVTQRDLLSTPEAVPALRAGALGDFTTGYEQLINLGGMLADEWIFSETFPTRIVIDMRTIDPNNGTLLGTFASVSTANAAPEFSARRIGEIQAAFPDSKLGFYDERAEGHNLSSMAKILFAEHYCEGVPLSRLDIVGQSLDFQYGNPLTRNQMLDSAIAGFVRARSLVDTAGATGAAALDVQRNLSRVGHARALLSRAATPAQIAATVLPFLQANPVPLTYTYRLEHSANSGGENNQVWNFNTLNERISVASSEGTNGLPYRAVRAGQPGGRDPRVLWIRTPANDVGFDNSTPQFDALKYPDRPAFTVIASGVEARLMAAEAQLAAGNPQAMLDTLNMLRAQVQPLMQLLNYDYVTQQQRVGYAPGQSATLAPLTLPATPAAQLDLLMEERAYWLVFSAHRLGDMRRLVRQYGRDQSVVFPVGAYHKGGTYGSDVNFPIPIQEANNPNAPEIPEAQCMNRAA